MKNILVVDDDRSLANLTKLALEKKGYQVRVLNDGVYVLDEVKRQKPDLILMDVLMPKSSGADTVSQLRKVAEYKSIPVVFLTGLIACDEDLESAGLTIDGSNYTSLGKPYELENLYRVVEQSLSKAGR